MAVSVVVLSRGDYDALQIAERYVWQRIVRNVIIWNSTATYIWPANHPKVTVVNCRSVDIYHRFAAALLGTEDCIICADDSVVLHPDLLFCLYKEYRNDSTKIYGYKGFDYNRKKGTLVGVSNVASAQHVDFLSLYVSCFNKAYAAKFLTDYASIFKEHPIGANNEHIAFSHMVTCLSSKKPVVLPLPGNRTVELSSDLFESEPPAPIELDLATLKLCQTLLLSPALLDESNVRQKANYLLASNSVGWLDHSETFGSRYKKVLVKTNHGFSYYSFEPSKGSVYSFFIVLSELIAARSTGLSIVYFFLNSFPESATIRFEVVNDSGERKTYTKLMEIDRTKLGVPSELTLPLDFLFEDNAFDFVNVLRVSFHFRSKTYFEFCFPKVTNDELAHG